MKLKTIKIDKTNVQEFACEMNKFADSNRPNKHCYGMQDLAKEERALTVNDALIEAMDHAGFDLQSITAFKDWNIDDLVSPRKENPVLYFKSWFWECYFENQGITKYYAHDMGDKIYGNYVKLPD